MPLLSIVIANYNYGRFLDEAIHSVLSQSCQDFELIVVDGGSTDNSVEVIKRYASRIAWWCSEKDMGQSNAFNKGFSHANGKYLTWLNADDVMIPGALKCVVEAIKRNPDVEWFACGGCYLDEELNVTACHLARKFSDIRAESGELQVFAPSSFFAKSLLERVGGKVDEDYHYLMDTELWERFYWRGGARYLAIPGICWGLRLHRDAKMSGHDFPDSPMSDHNHPTWKAKNRERNEILKRYCRRPLTFIRRCISARWLLWLMGLVLTFRYRGRPYVDLGNINRKSL